MNFETQYYKSIPLNLVNRNYCNKNAMRYVINHTNQNVWIPKQHLLEDGTLRPNINIDYVFRKAQRQLTLAGITQPIIGIKFRTNNMQLSTDTHFIHSTYDVETER